MRRHRIEVAETKSKKIQIFFDLVSANASKPGLVGALKNKPVRVVRREAQCFSLGLRYLPPP